MAPDGVEQEVETEGLELSLEGEVCRGWTLGEEKDRLGGNIKKELGLGKRAGGGDIPQGPGQELHQNGQHRVGICWVF